jgi:phytoene/squalene synthetase
VNRTKDLFEKGRELCAHVNPLVKMHLRLTWLGGMTILKKIEDDDYNVFSRRPKIRAIDKARLVWHAVSW